MASPPGMAATPGFKSQHHSSSAAPFLTPPTISYTCQHSCIIPALLGCHSKSGQVWPCGMEPIISKLSCRHCNQGELPPSYILGGSHFHPPGSKLFNISMKPVKGYGYVKWPCQRLAALLLLYKTALNGPAPCVLFPKLRLVGMRTPYIFFSNFPGHLEFWTPLEIPIWGRPLGCTLLQIHT